MNKVLVAFFSASGITARIAKAIAEAENGDCFEIKAKQPYTQEDLDYNVKDSRCNVEMADESCRPEIDGQVEDMDQYTTIFLGFPIWWGREPSIIDTFLEAYDFAGKKIIPFCTSGMSGVEKAVEHIKGIVKDAAEVDEGKRMGAEATIAEVKFWTEFLKNIYKEVKEEVKEIKEEIQGENNA